ncbi:hypothetical protein RB653_005344 [Dictyostelium firmibasis]|uniref:Uncharacterized protein n=1 Tax=Dictyostelium firmibasis TaxID=79012 RepID=A0AAN7Z417_9MYCE
MPNIQDPLLGAFQFKSNHNVLNSVLAGFGTLLIYIVYYFSSDQINLSELTHDGIIKQYVYYGLILTACFVSPITVSLMSEKYTMVASSLVITLVFFLNYFNITLFSMIIKIISLFTIEILWTAVIAFLIVLSNRSNISLNFGIFFSIFGLYLGFYSIYLNLNTNLLYLTIFIIFIGLAIMIYLMLDGNNNQEIQEIEIENNNGSGILTSINIIGSPRFYYVIPSLFYLGFSNFFLKLVLELISLKATTPSINYYNLIEIYSISFSLMSFIWGCMILYKNKTSSIVNEKPIVVVSIVGFIGIIASLICLVISYNQDKYINGNNWSIYLSIILFALVDSILTIQIYCSLGSLFENKALSIVASIRIIQYIGSLFGYTLITWISSSFIVGFYLLVSLLLLACFTLYTHLYNNEN